MQTYQRVEQVEIIVTMEAVLDLGLGIVTGPGPIFGQYRSNALRIRLHKSQTKISDRMTQVEGSRTVLFLAPEWYMIKSRSLVLRN